MIYVVIISIILLFIVTLFVLNNYLKLKDFEQNIFACTNNINELLVEKKEILDDLIKKVDDKKISELYNSYSDDETLFVREEVLFNVNWEMNKFMHNKIDEKDERLNDDIIKDSVNKLNRLEENLEGLREYYNTNALNFNEIYFKKPFYYLYKLFKYDEKKSFKYRKLEEYEILKN